MSGRVVVLNGVSSAGKSSIVRALLACAPGWHAVAMDDHLATLPADSFGTPAGLTFVPGEEDGAASTAIVAGPIVRDALARMRAAVADMAASGRDVVVDDVMLAPEDETAYRALVPAAALWLVAVRAPLAVVEERERARGDRMPGLARWQFARVHAGRHYDLELDSANGSPAVQAAALLAAVGG